MYSCTFFGHRDALCGIEGELYSTIIDLIEDKGVTMFYVGDQGNFDRMVKNVLISVKRIYPEIIYSVVLSKYPCGSQISYEKDLCDSIYPEEVALSSPKYAICKRNRWMIENSDYVICYVAHDFGNAYKYKEFAVKKGKTVINIFTDKNREMLSVVNKPSLRPFPTDLAEFSH